MSPATPGSPPTARELAVLRAVCRPGSSVARAAYELGIAPGTARFHLRSLYLRLEVNSAAQATYRIWGEREAA